MSGILRPSVALAAAIGAVLATPASAQSAGGDMLEEVIVTATKRSESLQEVPIAISVFSEQALRDAGANDFASLVAEAPGIELRVEQKGSGAASIRGIAELNTDNIFGTTGTAVGLYIDESPFSVGGFFPQSALYDVKRVEILRGPQGTIFGEGSLAGTIRIVTNRPDPTAFLGSVDATYGSITDGGSNQDFNAMLNLPLIKDRLAARIVGFYYDDGGWIDRVDPVVTPSFGAPPNVFLGANVPSVSLDYAAGPETRDVNTSKTSGGRLQLEYSGDSFTATLSALNQKLENGYRNRGRESRIGIFSTDYESLDDKTNMYGLVLEWKLDRGSILSSSNYFDRDLTSINDQFGIIWVANQIVFPLSVFYGPMFEQPPFWTQGSRASYDLTVREFNQELRYVSDFKGPFEITAGAFYRDRTYRNRFQSPQEPLVPGYIYNLMCGMCGLPMVPGNGDNDITSNNESKQMAVFAEGTWKVTDSVKLLLGGRYFKDKRDSDSLVFGVFAGFTTPTSFTSQSDESIFNPRASVTFDISDSLTSYVSASRGFRSGGSNDLFGIVPGATPEDETYDSERLTAYEIGLKGNAWDGRVSFSGALFLNQWDDLQVVTKEGPGGVGEIISNAGNAESKGIDLEATIRATDHLTFGANATFLDTNIEDIVASGVQYNDVDIPYVADTRLNASVTYRRPMTSKLGAFVRANVSYTSEARNNLTTLGTVAETLPSYTTVGLRAGIEAERWAVTLFATNLTDEFIPLRQFYSPNPDTPSGGDAITGEALYDQGSPRVIGVNVRFSF